MANFINEIITGNNVEILRSIDDSFVDLTVTSPPYDNLRDYKGFKVNIEGIAKELYRVSKEGGVVVWIVSDATINGSETGTSFKHALKLKEVGFNLHDTMIWNKGCSPFQHKNRYINCFEYMFVFSKGKPTTYNIIKDRKNKWAGTQVHGTERQRSGNTKSLSKTQKAKQVKEYGSRLNIWEINPEKNNKTGHPAVFPETLASDHIITWSNPGDIVLDIFGGSGTTAKMALKNDRKFIHIDISEEYNEIARKRLEDAE